MILGTGLGRAAVRIEVLERLPYSEIPHFPRCTVESHGGSLLFGRWAGRSVVVMEGRFHYYEGYSLQDVTLPVRVMKELGARLLFIASAAGGLNPLFRAGDVMIVTDHINLMGDGPLRGLTDDRLGDRFPDMTAPYDHELIEIAGGAAIEKKIPLRVGVYAGVAGPNLETRTETRMLRLLGADTVGMSTVPEAIVAVQAGLRTLALNAITNVNIPDAMEPVSVDQVIATAEQAAPKIADIFEAVLGRVDL